MLEKLYELLKQLLGLSRDVKQHDAQIKELQDEMETVISAVQDLAFEIRRMRETEIHEREKTALRLENAMLKFERRLMSGEADAKVMPEDPD